MLHLVNISLQCSKKMMHHCGVSVSTPPSYAAGRGFKPRHRLTWLRIFMVILSLAKKISEHNLKIGHDRDLSHQFYFVIP
jgi:hypothetical protein